jgi:hypothetical protein
MFATPTDPTTVHVRVTGASAAGLPHPADRCYALFAVENEFGSRAGREGLLKAPLGGGGDAGQQIRLQGTHRAQLHFDVYAARGGDDGRPWDGAAAWDDVFIGEARLQLDDVPSNATPTHTAVPIRALSGFDLVGTDGSPLSLHVAVEIVRDAARFEPAAPASKVGCMDASTDFAATRDSARSSPGAACLLAPPSPKSYDDGDATAQRISALEQELAGLRAHRRAAAAGAACA